MELILPEQIAIGEATSALLDDVEETARRVNEYRPLPKAVVQRIEHELIGPRVYSSNAIEGSTLDLRETVTVLNTGRILENRRREATEARNLGEAVRRVSEIVSLGPGVHTVERLLEIHKMILRDAPDDCWGGRFREDRVLIDGAKYQPPSHTVVPALVDRLMERLRKQDETVALVKACWAHWALARIHPFKDGNGRTARLWQDLVLFQEGLTCAIITPGQRKDYLDALTQADDGDFNMLIQLVARSVLQTFDRYLAEIGSDKQLDDFAREVAGEATARIAEKRELAYSRWARQMERLQWEFDLCAARITEAGGGVRVQLRKYKVLDKPDWEIMRSAAGVSKPWFFALYFDSLAKHLRYSFFFDKHQPTESDDERDRSENRVGLRIAEDDGTGKEFRMLDEAEDSPISLREVFLADDQFVVKRRDARKGDMKYERGVPPLRIAQDFIKEVILRRLT